MTTIYSGPNMRGSLVRITGHLGRVVSDPRPLGNDPSDPTVADVLMFSGPLADGTTYPFPTDILATRITSEV